MFPNQVPPQTDSARIFNAYYTTSFTNWTLTHADKTPLYYIRTSSFRPGRPEVTVHAGGVRDGPTVGVVNFVKFSSNSKIGLGDPDDARGVTWEDLEKVSRDHSTYRFECAVGPQGTRKAFLWKRTHSVGAGDEKPSKISSFNFKLVDEASGDVLGAFTKSGITSFKKQGTFQLDRDYGRDFDLMAFLSAFAVLERAHRRKAARSGGGGDT